MYRTFIVFIAVRYDCKFVLVAGDKNFMQAVLGKILEPKLWLATFAFHWIITAELCPAPSHIVRLTPAKAFMDRL